MRRGVAVFVVVLTACGDPAVQQDAGTGSDASPDGTPPIVVDAGVDAPSDAPPDAPPRCGDNHVDPGEQCDGIEGLGGDGCSAACTPEPIEWTNLTPNPMPVRSGTAVAYDSARHRLVMFGGSTDPYAASETNETWEYDGTTWVKRLTLVAPPARVFHGMVYDSARQRVVMFGGQSSTASFGDTWEWDGSAWIQRASTGPLPATFPRIAYDPMRQVTVLWEAPDHVWEWDGTSWSMKTVASPVCCIGGMSMTYAGAAGVMLIGDDAQWTWDGTSWTRQAFPQPLPWAQSGGWAVFDTTLGRPLVITKMLGVWEWANGAWVQRHAPFTAAFPLPIAGNVAFDSDRGLALFLAGPFNGLQFANVWEWNGTSWRQRYDSVAPPRGAAAFAYDARRGRLVMFGGDRTSNLWEWDGTTWHLRTTTSVAPTARWDAAAAYDERRGRVVIHGGYAMVGGATDDTWEWDGFTWRQVVSNARPGQRVTMTFDRAQGHIMAVDELNGDTWTYDGAAWSKLAPALAPRGGRIAYDTRRGVVVLLTTVLDTMGNSIAQVWEWSGTNWSVKGDAPTDAAVFYDPVRGRIVAHDGTFPIEQFWTWDGSTWSSPITTHRPIEPKAIFDPTTGSWFSFGTESGWDTWLATSGTRDTCNGPDSDGDGLARCADPDCWWRCTPLCAPGEQHCDPFAPHCGDGVCSALEANVCPADCP